MRLTIVPDDLRKCSAIPASAAGWAAALMLSAAVTASSQEALRSSLASQAAVETRKAALGSMPYTIKSGDFRLLVTPVLTFEYNDNVNTSHSDAQDDFIIRPMVRFDSLYPLTQNNLLTVNAGIGYDQYCRRNEFSGLRIDADSEVAFNFYIKDFTINFHDRFSYVRDPAAQASLAGGNTGKFANFNNAAGVLGTWDGNDLTANLGYDHVNVIPQSGGFDYLKRSSEMFLARAGLKVHPQITAGLEGTATISSYAEPILNDNTGYSAGVFGDWRPGPYFRVQPRAGYALYDFSQTSRLIRAEDSDSWYFDVILSHQATETFSYNLSVGHELLPGTQSDITESTYVRPTATWRLFRDFDVSTFVSYEHGKQSVRVTSGAQALNEKYDWLTAGVSVGHPILKWLYATLSYRFTSRLSEVTAREYTQDLVGFSLSYRRT